MEHPRHARLQITTRAFLLSPTNLFALQVPASTFFRTIPSLLLLAIQLHYDAHLDLSRNKARQKLRGRPSPVMMHAQMNTAIFHFAAPRVRICPRHL